MIRDVCRITHHSDEAYVGALAVVLAIRSVVFGDWSFDRSFLAISIGSLPDSAVRDRVQELLPLKVPASEIARTFGATGHVVDTVPLALYCAQSIASRSFAPVLAEAIGVGGDTDTIGSITGQIAGTVVGSAGIPDDHIAAVSGSNRLKSIAEGFAEFVESANRVARAPQRKRH